MRKDTSTILVPLDGSKSAEWALPYAIYAAEKLNATIELLCVSSRRNMLWQWPSERVPEEAKGGVEGGPTPYLNVTAKRIEAVAPVQVLCTLRFGSAADVIVRHSKVRCPDLVILSTHGRGPMSRVWLGSVADRVMRHASMPVLLVRPEEGVEVDLSDRLKFCHILVALDGSPQAEASIHWAKKLGDHEAAFSLVRVEPTVAPAWTADPESAPLNVRDYSKTGHDEAEGYLRGVEGRAMHDEGHVSRVVMEGVPAAAGILRAAYQESADLIALTSHGRGRLPNLIMGSVTDKVVRASNLPVLVVRRKSVESELPQELEFPLDEETYPAHTEIIEAKDQRGPTPQGRRKDRLSASMQDRAEAQRRYWA